jgi:hypothetical protein
VNPPSGHIPRTHSITVQSAAMDTARIQEGARRSSAGVISPNAAVNAAQSSVSAHHAFDPNRAIQYRVAP